MNPMAERYDIAIIGTGPAGLEAAITSRIRNKKILLIGNSEVSEKIERAEKIDNYLGLPAVSGEDMQKRFLEHIASLDIEITNDRVNAVYAMGSFFEIQGHKQNYQATSCIIAAGMTASKPFPGEKENLGRGVSYCATCDAALYKGREAVVVAYSTDDEEEADFLAERADKVYYLPQYKFEGKLRDNVEVIEDAEPIAIDMKDGKSTLEIKKKQENSTKKCTSSDAVSADGIFILREQVAPDSLVPGLKMDGNHIMVDRAMSTSIPGLFACGDITGLPYQYIKAAGEGNIAALSAVKYLGTVSKS